MLALVIFSCTAAIVAPLIHSVLPSLPDLHILEDIRQHSTIHSQAQLDRVRFL